MRIKLIDRSRHLGRQGKLFSDPVLECVLDDSNTVYSTTTCLQHLFAIESNYTTVEHHTLTDGVQILEDLSVVVTSSSLVLVSTLPALLSSFRTHSIPRQLERTQTTRATSYRNNTSVDNTGSRSSKNTNELVPLLSTTEHMVSLCYRFNILQQSNYSAFIPMEGGFYDEVYVSLIHWHRKNNCFLVCQRKRTDISYNHC